MATVNVGNIRDTVLLFGIFKSILPEFLVPISVFVSGYFSVPGSSIEAGVHKMFLE
jgi:hypothetical protein